MCDMPNISSLSACLPQKAEKFLGGLCCVRWRGDDNGALWDVLVWVQYVYKCLSPCVCQFRFDIDDASFSSSFSDVALSSSMTDNRGRCGKREPIRGPLTGRANVLHGSRIWQILSCDEHERTPLAWMQTQESLLQSIFGETLLVSSVWLSFITFKEVIVSCSVPSQTTVQTA